jgi:hypothetical protein
VSRSAAFLDDEKSHFGMTVTLETQRFADALSKNQTLAAITTKNVAWVRNHKASNYNLRRAVLNASRVLSSDERNHWLKLFVINSADL